MRVSAEWSGVCSRENRSPSLLELSFQKDVAAAEFKVTCCASSNPVKPAMLACMGALTKTDYLLFRECRKNAWLKLHRPDIYFASQLSAFDKALIETGNEVELLARQLFPGGVLIEGRDWQAQNDTLNHLAKKTRVLFQPVFLKDGFLAALDVLQLDPVLGGYFLYEVKAANELKEDTHLSDLAFQWVLLQKVGLPVRRAHLIHLNPDYVRDGELNLQELFAIEDVTAVVQGLLAATEMEMRIAQGCLTHEEEPTGHCDCISKGRSRHCSTFHYSNPDVPEYGVHDIARIGISKTKLVELAQRGILRLEDLPKGFELTAIQQNQVDAYLHDRVLIRREEIARELKRLTFPLHFLDYETCPAAIPRFSGYSPYQQIPFQYSLHILDQADGKPRHEGFLSTAPGDPAQALCASLNRHVGQTGTVVVWNKKFECGINREMGKRIPGAKAFLDSLNARVYDLMDIFLKQYYVHKGFKGGTSIKDVLPVLAPELSYADLAIQEGGTASQSWDKITSEETSQAERASVARDLELYCERDTYAMYAIWRHLVGLIASPAVPGPRA